MAASCVLLTVLGCAWLALAALGRAGWAGAGGTPDACAGWPHARVASVANCALANAGAAAGRLARAGPAWVASLAEHPDPGWALARALGASPTRGAWEAWLGPSALLGAAFVAVTAALTAAELLVPAAWARAELPRGRKAGGARAGPPPSAREIGARMLPLLPAVVRNIALSAPSLWLAWNLREAGLAALLARSGTARAVADAWNGPWLPVVNESARRWLQALLDGAVLPWPQWNTWGHWVLASEDGSGAVVRARAKALLLLMSSRDLVRAGAWLLVQLYLMHAASQLVFYCMHRFAHSNAWVFRKVHALHHRHMAPFALTAIHCTVLEMWILNLPAVALGPLLLGPDPGIHCVWMLLVALYTPASHSGRALPLMDVAYHDEHHRLLNGNFGSATLDRLLGTRLPDAAAAACPEPDAAAEPAAACAERNLPQADPPALPAPAAPSVYPYAAWPGVAGGLGGLPSPRGAGRLDSPARRAPLAPSAPAAH